MTYTATELADRLQGRVIGDGSVRLTGVAPAGNAQSGDLTFAENQVYFRQAELSPAAAILVDADFPSSAKPLIRVASARVALATVLHLFFPEPVFQAGVHPSSVVSSSARIDPSAHVGPLCFVGERVQIGARAVLEGNNHVAADSSVGAETRLFPGVVLYPRCRVGSRVRIHAGSVIGSDGFGYVLDGGLHRKIPQVGWVIIEDDVEIGANVTVDRGALGPTVIGKGTKIDNLVQLGHNVVIGEHSLIVAQTGIAGSTTLGQYVTLAGQVGVAGHLKIGNRVTVAAQSGIMHNIEEGQKWFGSPAQPDWQMKRQLLAVQKLPGLLHRIKELERRLETLESRAVLPDP